MKGYYYELYIVKKFYDAGFGVVRTPASGARTKRSVTDIVAGNGKVYYAIEVKHTSRLPLYIRKDQLEKLRDFCKRFGAKGYIALHYNKKWYFIPEQNVKNKITLEHLRDSLTLDSLLHPNDKLI